MLARVLDSISRWVREWKLLINTRDNNRAMPIMPVIKTAASLDTIECLILFSLEAFPKLQFLGKQP
jgi:hypothetical protein